MIRIREDLSAVGLEKKVKALFDVSAQKIKSLDATWRPEQGAPVFTIDGKYTSRGWTEWTQGFQFGAEILQFDATGDKQFLELGARIRFRIWRRMCRTRGCMIMGSIMSALMGICCG